MYGWFEPAGIADLLRQQQIKSQSELEDLKECLDVAQRELRHASSAALHSERELTASETELRSAQRKFETNGGSLYREVVLNFCGILPSKDTARRRPPWREDAAAKAELDWWNNHRDLAKDRRKLSGRALEISKQRSKLDKEAQLKVSLHTRLVCLSLYFGGIYDVLILYAGAKGIE